MDTFERTCSLFLDPCSGKVTCEYFVNDLCFPVWGMVVWLYIVPCNEVGRGGRVAGLGWGWGWGGYIEIILSVCLAFSGRDLNRLTFRRQSQCGGASP